MFCFFGHKAYGILAPRPGIKAPLPALAGEILTTGLPEKSQWWPFLITENLHIPKISMWVFFFPLKSKAHLEFSV